MPPSSGLVPCGVTSLKTIHYQNGAGLRGQRVKRRCSVTDRQINTGREIVGIMRSRDSTDGGRREIEEIREFKGEIGTQCRERKSNVNDECASTAPPCMEVSDQPESRSVHL